MKKKLVKFLWMVLMITYRKEVSMAGEHVWVIDKIKLLTRAEKQRLKEYQDTMISND
jgi:uncharacterized membrane protein YgcG